MVERKLPKGYEKLSDDPGLALYQNVFDQMQSAYGSADVDKIPHALRADFIRYEQFFLRHPLSAPRKPLDQNDLDRMKAITQDLNKLK